jgi:cation diffusion facilitator CzcD-associated flavoprotein CzcO
MGLKTLIVDKLPRLGDNWRSRYETVRSHTPIYSDHYPFLKFPTNWPTWLDQDKITNWMEHYGQILELDFMLDTTVTGVNYDKATKRYTVEVQNADGIKVLKPRHVVLATGLFSPLPVVPDFPGQKDFAGELYHSIKHKGARFIPDLSNKRVAIVGTGASAHDIAQDFVNAGAKEVSIVQRHSIFSVSAEAVQESLYGIWNTAELSTEEADIIANSFPIAVARTFNIGQTLMMNAKDKEMLDGLEKAGMGLKKASEVGYGILDHQLIKGGHFYIDQGANPMIVDGRIKIHRCEEGIKEFIPKGLVLVNGKKFEADVVVLATGFHRNILNVEEIMGKEVAKKVGQLGFLDAEQERIAVST